MAYEQITIHDIVDRAVNHSWSIPEFQRGFVWKATQVRDLAESLWYDYPIGSLLVWNSHRPHRGAARPRRSPAKPMGGRRAAEERCALHPLRTKALLVVFRRRVEQDPPAV